MQELLSGAFALSWLFNMKNLFYSIYAIMFNIFRYMPMKNNKIAFLSPHNESFNDSLGAVMNELILRDEFDIKKISCTDLNIDKGSAKSIIKSLINAFRFFTIKAYHLATSHYVFMNDNFMPMGKLNFKKKAVITQLWHAEGVFKRFGLHINQPDEVRALEIAGNKKLDFVVCSSEGVSELYSEAFGISKYKVLPLGAPRTDHFFKRINAERLRADFDKLYPECKGKRLVLYAPTFRDNSEDDKRLLDNLDIEAFNDRFGDDTRLLVRLHPQVHTAEKALNGATDVSDYKKLNDLIRLCEILITDYSSICMDFALLEKPIYFYAFDLEKYAADRAFYHDYESYVPGPVARDFQTLLNLINNNVSQTYNKRMLDFKFYNFGIPDGNATKRVVDYIVYDRNI